VIINKNDVAAFLDGLRAEYRVFAPAVTDGVGGYRILAAGGDLAWGGVNTSRPPKEILFPQSEKLYSYRLGADGVEIQPHYDVERNIIFGIRPCDAKSFKHLDNVFLGQEYRDVYYQKRRENTLLIGMACLEPAGTCFCTWLGGGPFATDGLDLLWVDLGDRYLVQVLTPQGKALIEGRPFFLPATEADRRAASAAEARAKDRMRPAPDLSQVKPWLAASFNASFWEHVCEKCIGCAVCSYLCPTCHCFDLSDEAAGSQALAGARVRTWDTCAFPLFTLQASGYNPRPTGKERFRQRIMHKFCYFAENWGEAACVGCGRCIINCPVNLDIREVLAQIAAQAAGAGMSQ